MHGLFHVKDSNRNIEKMLQNETICIIIKKKEGSDSDMKTRFHEYLARYRKLRGYTQSEMAERLEISRSTYTNYETGHRSPDLDMLQDISEVLDCSIDELFGKDKRQLSPLVCETKSSYSAEPVKKLAVGMQDFRDLREANGYYVDKTHMINEFLDSGYQVTLITRPRRFGKTLNMSMMAEFLDCTKQSEDVFTGTKVSRTDVMKEMNGYPVIFLSFLNVKGSTAGEMLYQLMDALRSEFYRYMSLSGDEKMPEAQREELGKVYKCLCQSSIDEEVKSSIRRAVLVLCRALQAYYGKKVYLLLDEYDTPFISANTGGYYAEVRDLLAGMFSSSLKGNPALGKAILTGIQRLAKENIFSGLNNLMVCTVCDSEYSDCFGFSEEETKELLQYYGLELTPEVKGMYDGYRFGMMEVYNPWSVTCFAARKRLDPYWVNTSENSIIQHAIEQRGRSFAKEYRKLIERGAVSVSVELAASYYEPADDASVWGLLINAGMLTAEEYLGDGFYKLRIPNYEVRKAFQNLTSSYLKLDEGRMAKMLRCLQEEEMEEFAEAYQQILLELPSYHDLKTENSYHMMMLGMCAFLYKDYEVKSNRESGTGRSDILLCAKNPKRPNMILEFKYAKDESQNLEDLAGEAIEQIKEKKYDTGVDGRVYYVGLAHCGKMAAVKWEMGE